MKYIFALCSLTILSVFAFTATTNSFKYGPASPAGPDSSYSGDGQLAYTIDSRKVNIKTYLQTGGKNFIALYINEVAKKDGGLVRVNLTNYLTQGVINFLVADKGTTHILHYKPSFNDAGTQGEVMIKYENYYADDVTVQITAIDNKHVAGTFSGKFLSGKKNEIQITNGSFDVPYKNRKLNP